MGEGLGLWGSITPMMPFKGGDRSYIIGVEYKAMP